MGHRWPHCGWACILWNIGKFFFAVTSCDYFLQKIRRGYLTAALARARKRAGVLRHPYILSAPQRQAWGENQKWLPHPSLLLGREEGGYAMSPLHSGGSPKPSAGTKFQMAHRRALRLQASIFRKIGNILFVVRSCNLFLAEN